MGCDIHPFVQWVQYPAKDGKPEWWSNLAGEWDWGRSYDLFARLAGVRCRQCEWGKCTHAIVPPRGWPETNCPRPPYFRDLHTPTWLTLAEFKEAAGDYGAHGQTGAWPEIQAAIAAMEAIEATGHKTRIVIAFDN